MSSGQVRHRRVVPETYVQLLYEYLDARDHSPETVFGMPWPSPDPRALGGVSDELMEQMLERAEILLDDPLIGLHVGQSITSRHLGVFGALAHSCESLGAALQRFERYVRLLYDVIPMNLRIGPDWIDIAWDCSQYVPGRRLNETGAAAFVHFCRSLVRGQNNPLSVQFLHAAPANVCAYEEFFGCSVLFNQPEGVLRFDANFLSLPLKSPDPLLIALLEQHAERLLAQLPQQNEVVDRVRKTIVAMLREGEPDIEKVSKDFHCTPRTLQRRLHGAGTSFRAELNKVRSELASSYLRDPRLQVVDVALLLGYSEHSAFTRAFRGWTGRTPQQVRDEVSVQGI